jgi:hypothetical protein
MLGGVSVADVFRRVEIIGVEKDPRLAVFKPTDPRKKSGSVYSKDVCWLAPYTLRGVLWHQGGI